MKNQWCLIRAFSKTLPLTQSNLSTRTLCSSTSSSSSSSFALKNVTKANFESALEDLRKHVTAADFVSIDLEMTGVTSAPWRETFEFDRYDVQYLKVKDSAEKFAVIQFGVCPFRYDSSKQSFIAHPHNFYVFPRQEFTVPGSSYEFLCQTSSIDFLAKYKFDFNVCIREGVSYLSRAQEDEALNRLSASYDDELSELWSCSEGIKDIPLVRIPDVLFFERMKNKISEWRDELLKDGGGGYQLHKTSSASKQQFQTIFFKMRPALSLIGFTSHQLRLIELVIKKHFKDLSYVRMNGEKLVVYTDSEHDRNELMKEVKSEHHKEEELKIKSAVGFRHVIDMLSSEKKLIVGHNCFLGTESFVFNRWHDFVTLYLSDSCLSDTDIAHIYSKFLHPLPVAVEDFVSSIHKHFPYIVDTKILLNYSDILRRLTNKSGTSLSSAFSVLCPHIASTVKSSGLASTPHMKVEVQVDDLRSSSWNSGAKHEAGYDAFMTGCVFSQACAHISIDFEQQSSSTKLANHAMLQKYMNLLYLSWTNGDIINVSTGNRNSVPLGHHVKRRYGEIIFSNIVLLWGLPPKLKVREIRDAISKVFGHHSVITIYHLDQTAVFIQFSKEEFVSRFLDLIHSLERNKDPISVLHPFSKLLEGGNARASGYEVYKEICGSSMSKVIFADQANAVGSEWKTKLVNSAAKPVQENELIKISDFVNVNARTKEEKSDVIDDHSCSNSCDVVFDSLYASSGSRFG
ncbi:Ribonuclease CAF1 [Dillenia turbinata]|uniref:Ribonuclease CAF1 n=1 Tax=Dillenia turbinata TaxID=194707 RepID=A0AAN8VIA6_9MAGN